MKDIILVGYGGHAKSVADCIERQNEYRIVGYTDLQKKESKYEYLGTDRELERYFNDGIFYAAVGVGYLGKGIIRQKIYYCLKEIGFELPVIADPSSIISESAIIGEGVFVGKGAVVNAESKIGKMAIINTKALVEHECEVGAFAHVAIATILCGQAKVGEGAFVGANATVIQSKEIEAYKVVPAGATIR